MFSPSINKLFSIAIVRRILLNPYIHLVLAPSVLAPSVLAPLLVQSEMDAGEVAKSRYSLS